MKRFTVFFCLILLMYTVPAVAMTSTRRIVDASGRTVMIPNRIDHIICSGSGCLRLVSYLGAQDLVVAVDSIENRSRKFDARPYAFANPRFKELPVFGNFRGRDIPEKIINLSPLPQVIFKTYANSGYDPVKLSKKTGIPVITLKYGDLADNRRDLYRSIRILGEALQRQERADELIRFFDAEIAQLKSRTENLQDESRKSCFVGGIAFKGPHGFKSTEPMYPPFGFINAKNIASPSDKGIRLRQSNFSKEKLLAMDPDVLFLDLSTLQMGKAQSGLHELRTDPVYRGLSAVKTGSVYGVLPYNWYTQNLGSILADAWYMGKILYPEQFSDIIPEEKADRIYTFLLAEPVFCKMYRSFEKMVFKRISVDGEN